LRLGETATEVARPIPVAEIAAVARAYSNPEDRRLVVNEQNRYDLYFARN